MLVLFAALIAIIAFWLTNAGSRPGPDYEVNLSGENRSFGITIENPTDSEDISIFQTPFDITIQREVCVTSGSTPSVTITLRFASSRSAVGTELNTGGNTITSTTTGNSDISFNNASISQESFTWIETTALSGTVSEISCTWSYALS